MEPPLPRYASSTDSFSRTNVSELFVISIFELLHESGNVCFLVRSSSLKKSQSVFFEFLIYSFSLYAESRLKTMFRLSKSESLLKPSIHSPRS